MQQDNQVSFNQGCLLLAFDEPTYSYKALVFFYTNPKIGACQFSRIRQIEVLPLTFSAFVVFIRDSEQRRRYFLSLAWFRTGSVTDVNRATLLLFLACIKI